MTAQDIFATISNNLQQGDLKGASALFFSNRDTLYEANPLLTLRTNFELRFIAEQFDEAYQDNEYFQALPYISQEVEEYLRELPRLIRANELSSFQRKKKSEDDILKLLVPSTKNEELLFLVSSLEKEDIAPYKDALISLLKSEIHDDVKSFILVLLALKNVDEDVVLRKHGKSLTLKPSHVGFPFQNEDYNALKEALQKEKDVGISQIAIKYLDQLSLYAYPHRPLLDGSRDVTLAALRQLAAHSLDPKIELGQEGQTLAELLGSIPPLSL